MEDEPETGRKFIASCLLDIYASGNVSQTKEITTRSTLQKRPTLYTSAGMCSKSLDINNHKGNSAPLTISEADLQT